MLEKSPKLLTVCNIHIKFYLSYLFYVILTHWVIYFGDNECMMVELKSRVSLLELICIANRKIIDGVVAGASSLFLKWSSPSPQSAVIPSFSTIEAVWDVLPSEEGGVVWDGAFLCFMRQDPHWCDYPAISWGNRPIVTWWVNDRRVTKKHPSHDRRSFVTRQMFDYPSVPLWRMYGWWLGRLRRLPTLSRYKRERRKRAMSAPD